MYICKCVCVLVYAKTKRQHGVSWRQISQATLHESWQLNSHPLEEHQVFSTVGNISKPSFNCSYLIVLFTFLFLVRNYVYLIYHFIHFCQGTFSPEFSEKPHFLSEIFGGSIHDLRWSQVLVLSHHETLASPPVL